MVQTDPTERGGLSRLKESAAGERHKLEMIETRNSERNVRTNNYPSTRTRSAGSALPAGFFSATGRPQAADRRAASATNGPDGVAAAHLRRGAAAAGAEVRDVLGKSRAAREKDRRATGNDARGAADLEGRGDVVPDAQRRARRRPDMQRWS